MATGADILNFIKRPEFPKLVRGAVLGLKDEPDIGSQAQRLELLVDRLADEVRVALGYDPVNGAIEDDPFPMFIAEPLNVHQRFDERVQACMQELGLGL